MSARDIRKEVEELGTEVKTVHSYCLGMLKKQIGRIIYDKEEEFLSEDLYQTMGECLKKREVGNFVKKRFSKDWHSLDEIYPEQKYRKLSDELEAWLAFHKGMLMSQVILEGIRFLEQYKKSSGQLEHLLVDEYQDLNPAEQKFIDLLPKKNLLVIGDPDQSIYGFKGADPQGIQKFAKNPEAEELSLTECHRCPKKVVSMANALIKHNTERKTDEAYTKRG